MKRVMMIVAAIAAVVILFSAWIAGDRTAAGRVFDEDSIENTSDAGLSLAFHYLQRSGHRAARLDRPLAPRVAAANGVVFRAGFIGEPFVMEDDDEEEKPQPKPQPKKNQAKKTIAPKKPARLSPLLTNSEEAWVRGGGRLVLAATGASRAVDIRDVSAKTALKVFPIWPGIDTIALPGRAIFAVPPRMVTLYEAADQPAIVRQVIGAGDLIIIATPEILENHALRSGNHLELLTALAGSRPVYFDETIHGLGVQGGAVELLEDWGLGPLLLLALATGVLMLWRRAARIGAPEDDHRELRSDAVDLVASLGALYRKAMTDGEALALYRETLVRTVAAQTGLRGDALHRRVSEITKHSTAGGETKMSAASMRRHLDAINQGFRTLEGVRAKHANHR